MLRLRPYKRCDAEHIVNWIKTEKSFYQWSAGRLGEYPITAAALTDHYDSMADRDDFYEMTAMDGCEVAGHMIMRFLDEEKTSLRFGFVVVDDTKRGKGYGREMLKLALKYAFEILKVSRVTIGVFVNNTPAYKCYKSLGFVESSSEPRENYKILNEEWECVYLEMTEDMLNV